MALYDGDGTDTGRFARLLIYGETKVGKSILGTTMPGPRILVATEENAVLATHTSLAEVPRAYGAGDTTRAAARVLRLTEWADVWEALARIERSGQTYRSVIFDSMSGLIDLLLTDVRNDVAGKHRREVLTQEDWGIINTRLQSFRVAVNRLPLHVLYIAHLRSGTDGTAATRQRPATPARPGGPDIPGRQVARFCADCSAVLIAQATPGPRGTRYLLQTRPVGDLVAGFNVAASRVAPAETPDLHVFLARLGGGYLPPAEQAQVFAAVPPIQILPSQDGVNSAASMSTSDF